MYYSYAINLAEPRFATMTPTWKPKSWRCRQKAVAERQQGQYSALPLHRTRRRFDYLAMFMHLTLVLHLILTTISHAKCRAPQQNMRTLPLRVAPASRRRA